MGLYDNTALDPNWMPCVDIRPATLEELQARGLEIHGSLSQRKVGSGATAVVLKATEQGSGRVVAVKVYKNPDQQVLHRNGDSIPMTNFFENERRMLAGLQACSAVPRYFYSVNTDTSIKGKAIQPFHVMEFIEGQRVTKFAAESLAGKSKRTERLLRLLQLVLKTIESIHRFGYLHRDISDGNVLVEQDGNIRLIDLAEASPLSEEHTRLVTTPGLGTNGVATKAQQRVRAIQTDDVNHACTIGYALFTGRWKHDGETPRDWQRNLINSGAPASIAKILTKGMRPRDTNLKSDPTVWNTAKEVDTAIEEYFRTLQMRRRAARWAMGVAAAVMFGLLIGVIGYWQFQQQMYSWHLNRLNRERVVLAEKPQEERADHRIRRRVERADELESRAATAHASGSNREATAMLLEAVTEIQQASKLAGDLAKLKPLQAPLQAMLHENQQWNTDCSAIRSRLDELYQAYLGISEQIESGDPGAAWQTMSQLQADLVGLIRNNQESYQIGELFKQFDGSTIGVDLELAKQEDFLKIIEARKRADAEYFQRGRWPEARVAILAEQKNLETFYQRNEDATKKASRLAANVELLNEQVAANQALRDQLQRLNEQMQAKQLELQKLDQKNNDILIAAAKDRSEREAVVKQLVGAQSRADDLLQKNRAGSAKLTELRQIIDQQTPQLTELAELKRQLGEVTLARDELQRKANNLENQVAILIANRRADSANVEAALQAAEREQQVDSRTTQKWDGTAGRLPGERRVLSYKGIEIAMRWCPPGKYLMGSPATEPERDADENQVLVTFARGFWMFETEVTQELWQAVMGSSPSASRGQGPKFPVYSVSHDDCVAFVAKLTDELQKANLLPRDSKLALPTEAQWEYAARAGSQTRFHFGDDETRLGDYAWFDKNSGHVTHPVATKKPNAWGLFDMAGNVWEWCADEYVDKLPGGDDPLVAAGASSRVRRGGSWDFSPARCRSALRFRDSPSSRLVDLGFRPALSSVGAK